MIKRHKAVTPPHSFHETNPPIIPNVEFVRSRRLYLQQKAPADSDRCRTFVPTRCRRLSGRKAHQRARESDGL